MEFQALKIEIKTTLLLINKQRDPLNCFIFEQKKILSGKLTEELIII